ncbi:porin family protein [Psychroflexus montanilacus]|uniref:porin family protein n=1 Tax=Psychroflexus montanilacus TaxID=2873598 RepID=UPI001CCD671B|nr:porin family protein [Psychroflexus montanilacus]MBZ9651565.1 PorT family protein [Psychroflexus montanilacus]
MKLTYATLVILLTFSISTLSAQQEYFEYGFKGGINLSTISGDNVSNYETRTSMNIGGYGLYKILPKFGIQAELLYSEQGFSNEFSDIDQTTNEEIDIDEILRMQYINLPVLLSYNVVENLWVEGGVQVGYLVDAELEQETVRLGDTQQLISETENINQNDRYESVDFALAGGLRYKLNQNFMVQARYTNGITDVDKETPGDQYNSIFSFSVGFVF